MLLISLLEYYDLFDVPAPYRINHSIQSIPDLLFSRISTAYLDYRRLAVDTTFNCRAKHPQLPRTITDKSSEFSKSNFTALIPFYMKNNFNERTR